MATRFIQYAVSRASRLAETDDGISFYHEPMAQSPEVGESTYSWDRRFGHELVEVPRPPVDRKINSQAVAEALGHLSAVQLTLFNPDNPRIVTVGLLKTDSHHEAESMYGVTLEQWIMSEGKDNVIEVKLPEESGEEVYLAGVVQLSTRSEVQFIPVPYEQQHFNIAA